MRQARYSMARMAVLVLQPLTLIKSVLGPDHRDLASSAAVRMLWGSGTDLLHQTGRSFLKDEASRDTTAQDTQVFEVALERLRAVGIQVASDPAQATHDYLELRREWAALARSFAKLMGYRWDTIEVGSRARNGSPRVGIQ